VQAVDAAKWDRLVSPFYLKMMRTNALHSEELLPAIAEAAREASASDVAELLGEHWRSTVMGAWYAVRQPAPEVLQALVLALESSHGSLDSPPLATAAALVEPDRAVDAMRRYCDRDASEQWGACKFVAAALEHVGGIGTACEPGDLARDKFAAMLNLAVQLRDLP
jgi:hypothetical protein